MKKMTLFRLVTFLFPRELKIINSVIGFTTLFKLIQLLFPVELKIIDFVIHFCFAFLHYCLSITLNYFFNPEQLFGAIVWMFVGYSMWKNTILVLYEFFLWIHG